MRRNVLSRLESVPENRTAVDRTRPHHRPAEVSFAVVTSVKVVVTANSYICANTWAHANPTSTGEVDLPELPHQQGCGT